MSTRPSNSRAMRRAGAALGITAGLLAASFVAAPVAGAATTGGNGHIAFVSKQGPHGRDVWVSEADGSRATLVTGALPGDHSDPVWSPEGGPHLGFITAQPGGPGDIWWTTPAGLEPFRATNTPDVDERSPNFSPGGGNIVYQRSAWSGGKPAGDHDIWAVNLMGTLPRPLEQHPADDIQPAYSQDMTLVAFASNRGGDGYGIHMIDLNSRAQPPFVIRKVVDSGRNPSWNPSQRQIAYENGGNIWSVAVDPTTGAAVGEPRQLTTHPPRKLDSNPQFSPNWRKILWQRGARIWTMNVDGTKQRPVKRIRMHATNPDMRPMCNVFPRTDGVDIMRGTNGPDLFCPSTGADIMYGYGGNDVLFGGSEYNVIYSGVGDDLVQSGGDRSTAGDLIYGEEGDDLLIGSPMKDVIHGGSGADEFVGQEADDALYGQDGVAGNDLLIGSKGDDHCEGDVGDVIWCGAKGDGPGPGQALRW